MKDLTVSAIDRQNILNNHKAIESMQAHFGVTGMMFENEYRFTRQQIVDFYEIDISTVNRYLAQHEDELRHNGYVNLKAKSLKKFKEEFGWMLSEGVKAPQLGVREIAFKNKYHPYRTCCGILEVSCYHLETPEQVWGGSDF